MTLTLLVVVAALESSCGRELERSITLAQCEGGALLVHEKVMEWHAFAGKEPSVEYSLGFHAADGRRVPIGVSHLPSYRLPTEDELALLREPGEQDWQLYVDPLAIDDSGYRELVHCLQTSTVEVSSRAAPSPVPAISAIRHVSIEALRKRYECAEGASLTVREDGLVYYQSDSRVLVGFIDDSRTLALHENALRYLSSRQSHAVPAPLSYFQRCNDGSGKTVFDEFEVTVVPGDTLWRNFQASRIHHSSGDDWPTAQVAGSGRPH